MNMRWFNPPSEWSEENGITRVKTLGGTDFWRHTYYGFVRDSGHFRYREVEGDFLACVRVTANYLVKYDQAGVMLRYDSSRWIKAGIEVANDQLNLCVVVTNDRSDWSLIPLPDVPRRAELVIHISRIGQTVTVRYGLNGSDMHLARVAAFTDEAVLQVGVMCCSPERAGFEAEFEELVVRGILPGVGEHAKP